MYVKPEAAITVLELLMMNGVSLKHVEQLGNFAIINSTTRSHLVGYFYTIPQHFCFVRWQAYQPVKHPGISVS
jgi:hypothetical protein